MEVCKTDVQKIVKYLSDAASLYDKQQGLRMKGRAWTIRQLIKKLDRKLTTTIKITEQ